MDTNFKHNRSKGIGSEQDHRPDSGRWIMTRREFLKSAAMAAGSFYIGSVPGYPKGGSRKVKLSFGIVTDSHYADIDTYGTRYYRESATKMTECIELMNDKEVDFLIHLGDFKNGAPENNIEDLQHIESIYARFDGPRYHVLGNHDMDSNTKSQFQSVVENTGIGKDDTYYSFDRKGVHFIVLDPNFRSDGTAYDTGNFHWTDANIPGHQLEWLKNDLANTDNPVILCTHQLLDSDEGDHYVKNAAEVRRLLESHPGVLTVFQGHQHQGQYSQVNNIHYYTLKAMVEGSGEENNSYAIVEILDNLTVMISGYRKAGNKELQSVG